MRTLSQNRTFTTGRRSFSLVAMLETWRQRQTLKRLDDRSLDDIGLTRAEVDAEAARSFWDAPATWRR